MTAGHGLKTVVNLVLVTSADLASEVNVLEALGVVAILGNARVLAGKSRVGTADGQEVRTQATNEPLDEDLEDSRADEGVEKTDDGVVGIPEGPDAHLHAEDDEDGDQSSQESGSPDWDDLLAKRVGELRVDDLAVGVERNSKRTVRCRVGEVDLRCCR